MFKSVLVFLLAAAFADPLAAQAPILSVPSQVPATGNAERADPAAWQAAMPSLEIVAAFIAEKEERGEGGAHIPRATSEFASGEEVYFYVSMANVARDPVGELDARFSIALRAQVRNETGEVLSPWLDIHRYEGDMTMSPDDPEYFQNWITGGLAPELPPGRYQLVLEFTDMQRREDRARVPVEVVLDLVYPEP